MFKFRQKYRIKMDFQTDIKQYSPGSTLLFEKIIGSGTGRKDVSEPVLQKSSLKF
jgi:hypothetical protein